MRLPSSMSEAFNNNVSDDARASLRNVRLFDRRGGENAK